ncbi:MAG: glycosyltransferase [Bacteroidales bacterium]|nr:glycosyltransferase [Bacteroidales bacterium]
MKYILSIVVPVYKVEAYLNECISSIVDQIDDNVEVILVDDGSPDNCPQICDSWAEKYNNIKVFHKSNGGLSDARNFGLINASGEYVWCVDSDDKLLPNAVKTVLEVIDKQNVDVCCFPLLWVYNIDKQYVDLQIDSIVSLTGKQYIKRRYFPLWGAPRFIIKRSLIQQNHIYFPKSLLHEDEYFGRVLMYYATNVLLLPTPIYYYRQRELSIVHSGNIKSIYDMIKICTLLENFINEKVKGEDFKFMKSDLSDLLYGTFIKAYKDYDKVDYLKFEQLHKKYAKRYFYNNLRYFDFKHKVRSIVFCIYPKLLYMNCK